MALQCTFSTDIYSDGRIFYSCKIEGQSITASTALKIQGKHEQGKSLKDVKEVIFNGCKLSKIPQGLTALFPFMEDLSVWSSNLRTINKKELREYKFLKRIFICSSNIQYIPGDLFDGFNNLEEISFAGNEIKIIEPTVLDGLRKLRHVNFSRNPNYDMIYSTYPNYRPNATLDGLKKLITNVFLENIKTYKELMRAEFAKEMFNCDADPRLRNNFFTDLFNLSRNDESKDFTINIEHHEFHVHKFILVARSQTLAEIIRNNPMVENLNLVDIPVEIFKKILKYLYTDTFPMNEDILSYINIFAAAGRLKIEELKNFAANQMLNKVNRPNAVEILTLSNKYGHSKLRQKAFNEIKKCYPKLIFKDHWIEEPTIVADMIDKFKKKEDAIKRLEREFENERMEN